MSSSHPGKGPRTHSAKTPGGVSEARRERNRRAQHVFRLRKQAVQQAQASHIKRLESITEQITMSYYNLAGDLMESEAARSDSQLMAKLREAMVRTVALVKEASESMARNDMGESIGRSGIPDVHSEPPGTTFTTSSHSSSDSACLTDACPPKSTSSPGQENPFPPGVVTDAITSMPATQWPIGVFQATANDWDFFAHPGMSPNVFANGLEPSRVAQSTYCASSRIRPRNRVPFSASRLLRHCLHHAYFTLLEASDCTAGDAHRIFGFTLQKFSRDHILQSFGWFLGPGFSEARFQTFLNASFDNPVDQFAAVAYRKRLERTYDGSGTGNTLVTSEDDDLVKPFWLNARTVEDYLRSMNLRVIDDNTLELTVKGVNRNSRAAVTRASSVLRERGPPAFLSNMIDPGAFFPSEAAAKHSEVRHAATDGFHKPRNVKLSLPLLYENLARIGVCLACGTGFPAALLDDAIAASAIKT